MTWPFRRSPRHSSTGSGPSLRRSRTTLDAFDLLGRRPLPFETSIPGVFAAGDVRHGSMKRVAAAVGEGASAVHSVHQPIGT